MAAVAAVAVVTHVAAAQGLFACGRRVEVEATAKNLENEILKNKSATGNVDPLPLVAAAAEAAHFQKAELAAAAADMRREVSQTAAAAAAAKAPPDGKKEEVAVTATFALLFELAWPPRPPWLCNSIASLTAFVTKTSRPWLLRFNRVDHFLSSQDNRVHFKGCNVKGHLVFGHILTSIRGHQNSLLVSCNFFLQIIWQQ